MHTHVGALFESIHFNEKMIPCMTLLGVIDFGQLGGTVDVKRPIYRYIRIYVHMYVCALRTCVHNVAGTVKQI